MYSTTMWSHECINYSELAQSVNPAPKYYNSSELTSGQGMDSVQRIYLFLWGFSFHSLED